MDPVSRVAPKPAAPSSPQPLLLEAPRIAGLLPAPDPHLITADDRAQLRRWGSQGRVGSGVLLTPPIGHIKPEVRRVREYVEGIVEKLAGERLHKEAIRYVVNIYSGDSLNAFARGSVSDPKTPDTVRRLLGFDNDGKPIYEIVVLAGALKRLGSEDELAFMLGHELTHIFEHHSDPTTQMSYASRWFTGEGHEAVADQHGLELMVAAGWDAEGALRLLSRLFEDEKPDDANAAINALASGLSSHPQEGVRLSLLQGRIELMRRTDPRARPKGALTPLPEWTSLHVKPRDGRHEVRVKEYQQAMVDVTTKLLIGDLPLNFLTDICSYNSRVPKEVTKLFEFEPSSDQIGHAVAATIKAVESSPASKQAKVDGVLRLFHVLHSHMWYKAPLALNDEETKEISAFLARNSTGEDGWKAASYLSKLGRDRDSEGRTPYSFQDFAQVFKGSAFASVVEPLYHTSPEWKTLVDQRLDMLLVSGESGKPIDLGWVASEVSELIKPEAEKTALDDIRRQQVLHFFETRDLSSFATATDRWGNLSLGSTLTQLLDPDRKCADPAFLQRVRDLLKPVVGEFAALRDKRVLEVLRGTSDVDPKQTASFVRAIFRDARIVPFGPELERELPSALLALARRANQQKGYIYFDSFGRVQPLDNDLGKTLTGILSAQSFSAGDKREILLFMAANQDSKESLLQAGEKGRRTSALGHYVESLPPSEIVAMVESGNPEQYASRIAQNLSRVIGETVPPINDSMLVDYARRGEAGEFKVKPDLGPDGKPIRERYQQKVEDFVHRTQGFQQEIGVMVEHELNRRLSLLTFLGADREVSERAASTFSLDDLHRLLGAVEQAQHHALLLQQAGAGFINQPKLSTDAGVFLLDVLVAHQDGVKSLDDWYDLAHRIVKQSATAFQGRVGTQEKLEKFLVPKLEALAPDALLDWLAKENVMDALGSEALARLAERTVGDDRAALAGSVDRVVSKLKLDKDRPEAYKLLRESLAEKHRLQPGELDGIFPESRSELKENATMDGAIRGLSALVALTRAQKVPDQLDMIEYMMGRRDDMPDFVREVAQQADVHVPLSVIVEEARAHLRNADVPERVLVANSFLAGPHAFMRDVDGRKAIVDHLLRDVSSKHQKLAHRLADALLESQGSTDSLALAYVLGQLPPRDGKQCEAHVLSNLFDAYGVPGIKLKQYLAFTSEFSEFREVFEEAQDNAMPLSYYEAMRLVRDRFNGEWPPDLHIDKIMGSGSVNVAIRYYNPKTGEKEVIALARRDIETSTDYDFQRFKKLLTSLTKTEEDQRQFGYLVGLSDVIHASVTLEFDKAAAGRLQHDVQSLYRREVGGWHIRSVDAFDQKNMALFMEEAKGVTARKILTSDPAAYKSAMAAMSRVELDVLLGIDEHGRPNPVPLHANPDFHDGQVLVDMETRTITILDFGQAVPITNEDREYGLQLLEVIAKARSLDSSLKLLQKTAPSLKKEDVAEILDREDRMDIFIHLLSLMNRNGAKVPISVVHWIMAMQRQIALGEKAGISNASKVKHLVATHRLGGSPALYNTMHLAHERMQDVAASVVPGALSAWRAFRNLGDPLKLD